MIVTWRNVLADSCGVHQHVRVERSIKPLISTAGREERMVSDMWRLEDHRLDHHLETERNRATEADYFSRPAEKSLFFFLFFLLFHMH